MKTERLQHILRVSNHINSFVRLLLSRADSHDASKLIPPESEYYDAYGADLQKEKFGTDEYNTVLNKMGPALLHHYTCNRHHPQHFNAIEDMSLVDIVEMFCDWMAASERNNNGNIEEGISICVKRYGINLQLAGMFYTTVRELKGEVYGNNLG